MRKTLVNKLLTRTPKQLRPCKVQLGDPTRMVYRKVADRGKIIEVKIFVPGLLQREFRPFKLLVLNFKLKLMYLEFVDKLCIGYRRRIRSSIYDLSQLLFTFSLRFGVLFFISASFFMFFSCDSFS